MINDTHDIDNAIQMLKKHTDEAEIKPLILNLEALIHNADNEELIAELTETWRGLGIYQGTVLTYVPYFFKFIPDDIFGDAPE